VGWCGGGGGGGGGGASDGWCVRGWGVGGRVKVSLWGDKNQTDWSSTFFDCRSATTRLNTGVKRGAPIPARKEVRRVNGKELDTAEATTRNVISPQL